MSKRIGDRVTHAFALEGYWPAVEGPDNVDSRADGANELISLAEEIGDKEREFQGHDYRLHAFWTLADRAVVDVEIDALARLAEELRQPAQLWHVATQQTMLALMEGRFERAEQLISEALALGRQAESWNATVSQRLGLFVLRREQGRLAEIEDVIERSVHEYPRSGGSSARLRTCTRSSAASGMRAPSSTICCRATWPTSTSTRSGCSR